MHLVSNTLQIMPSLKQLFLSHVGQTSPAPLALEITHAKGVFLFDKNGKDYIDLISGVSVANLGHSNPVITDAIKKQLDKYMHTMVYGELIQEPQVKFAELLTKQLPASLNCVYFVNSGSEATEVAMKLAKRYTGRQEIISCKNAYHGSTQGALSLIDDDYFTDKFQPLLPQIRHIGFNNFDDLELISEKTACVIIEAVQGEAGVVLPKENYLKILSEKCRDTGTLLIVDEIQTGFGRTGYLFAFQQFDIIPDIILMAKSMGFGLPLGGVVADKKIIDYFTFEPVLGHITTFGGNPVSCASAYAGLSYLIDNMNIIKNVDKKANLFREYLSLNKNIVEIRNSGLLMAVDLGSSELLFKTMKNLLNEGILSDWFLFNDHSFRISPPLTISEKEIETACKRILKCLN